MEHDERPTPRTPPGERYESPFVVPHAPPPPEAAAERLEHLRCDPFEHADEREGERRASA